MHLAKLNEIRYQHIKEVNVYLKGSLIPSILCYIYSQMDEKGKIGVYCICLVSPWKNIASHICLHTCYHHKLKGKLQVLNIFSLFFTFEVTSNYIVSHMRC